LGWTYRNGDRQGTISAADRGQPPPSGNGFQFSIFGVFGVLVSGVEGFEVNILGLTSVSIHLSLR